MKQNIICGAFEYFDIWESSFGCKVYELGIPTYLKFYERSSGLTF